MKELMAMKLGYQQVPLKGVCSSEREASMALAIAKEHGYEGAVVATRYREPKMIGSTLCNPWLVSFAIWMEAKWFDAVEAARSAAAKAAEPAPSLKEQIAEIKASELSDYAKRKQIKQLIQDIEGVEILSEQPVAWVPILQGKAWSSLL
jgi:hypothetical protein